MIDCWSASQSALKLILVGSSLEWVIVSHHEHHAPMPVKLTTERQKNLNEWISQNITVGAAAAKNMNNMATASSLATPKQKTAI